MGESKFQNSKVFLVLRIVGIFIVAVGIILVIMGASTEVPDMSSSAWAEMSTKQVKFFALGGGCFLLGVVTFIFSFVPKIIELSIKVSADIVEDNKENISKITKVVYEPILNRQNEQTVASDENVADESGEKTQVVFCGECGAKLQGEQKFCTSCGKKVK